MELWANGVNAALQDHAGHIDHRASASKAQRVHMIKSNEQAAEFKAELEKSRAERDQLKANLTKVVSDVASNDIGMKTKLEAAFAELSGMVEELEGRCKSTVAEFKTSMIQAIDPQLEA